MMRRAFVIAAVTSFVCAVVACSGSSADPIAASSSSSGGANDDAGGGGGTSGGSSGETCPPCEPPPHPSCKGTGPCNCGPYTCDDAGSDLDSGTGRDSGRDSGSDGNCNWAIPDPCGPGKYCKTSNCGRGTCVPIGTAETFVRSPVCGCDGVTYWNESVAAKHGMSVRRAGECSGNGTAVCGGVAGIACPPHASCALKVKSKNDCAVSDVGGTCWGLPASCPPVAVGYRTRSCSSGVCADECGLMKTEARYYEDLTCPQ